MKNIMTWVRTLFSVLFVITTMGASLAHQVQVQNSSSKKIIKFLASADGTNYAAVSIGGGLKPGQTVDLNWNKSQNECEWYLKAVYADRSESTSEQFNLCEKDAVIDFH